MRGILAFIVSFLSLQVIHALPTKTTNQDKLAHILEQKPMHTTALMAGAAATFLPDMHAVSLRGLRNRHAQYDRTLWPDLENIALKLV